MTQGNPLQTERCFTGGRIFLLEGDITQIKVDAVVNAANSSLMGGGGVDGAIHRKGGPQILAECTQLRQTTLPEGLPTGQAVITGAGNLPASYVIHTVGPIYRQAGAGSPRLLRSCYYESLVLAQQKACLTIAFPAISSGVYGYPMDEASKIALETVASFMRDNPRTFEGVYFVLFGEDAFEQFAVALAALSS